MASSKRITIQEYFEKNNAKLMRFGNKFAEILNDEDLIISYAAKDLEKLTKIWKMVLEAVSEYGLPDPTEKMAALIGAYRDFNGTDPDEEE